MRIASVLTPLSPQNLQLAAQCGVEEIVCRYPGPELRDLQRIAALVKDFGMKLGIVEGYLPMEALKFGRDDGREIELLKTLIRAMADVGVPLLCYNFMAGTDWVRTQLAARERGGALVTGFDLAEAQRAVSLNASAQDICEDRIAAPQLWDNLQRMLEQLVPVAEACGVTLAMHPDDPPLPEFMGKARIMNTVESFERLVELVPSPANGICFCQGTFAEMGVDIPKAIRRLGPHIKYVHFRDIRGTCESFVETFHDNGQTDMVAAMQAYAEIGFKGPMRPDHVPQLVGEEDGEPGYTMLGRLFAFGYMRGLIQAVRPRS